jgi:endonuclease/exonuclease/phosphatase family metal-dependent hydrolase
MSGMSANLANANTTPVFLTGDFNAPSDLDWTNATASSHGGVGYVAFPASIACRNAGLIDSFRAIYPNPASHPGNTWSPLHATGEPQDRIDYVYYKGSGATPVDTGTYTTGVEVTLGAWGADTSPANNNTWPSDHAAVITDFLLN